MVHGTSASHAPLAILEADASYLIPFWRSPFRVREYEAILKYFPRAAIYSTWLAEASNVRSKEYEAFLRERPAFAGRILPMRLSAHAPPPPASLAYSVFLNNTFEFVHLFESHRIPFCLELYPGGGFAPGQLDSDRRLERLLCLPSFRRVITTQPVTQDYLLDQGYCRADQTEYIYGGVFAELDAFPPRARKRYGVDKDVLDVCFAAHRYMPRGEDKGYDLFIEAAQHLLQRFPSLRFHVFGEFNEHTIELRADLASHFHFYGPLPSAALHNYFADMDVIVSPNRASTLRPGAFDGFPTGCCMEAGLQGVVVVCTDPLRLNRDYRVGEDLLIVNGKVEELVSSLEQLLCNPDKIRHISESGRRTFRRLFSSETQITPRLRMLERELTSALPNNQRRGYWRPIVPSRCNARRYNFAELAAGAVCLVPNPALWKQYGYNYDLVQVQGNNLILACPPPQFGKYTEAILTLPYSGVHPVTRVELALLPYHPFPERERMPMRLLVAALENVHAATVVEQTFNIPPHFRPTEVALESSASRPIRSVKFRLHLADDAASNCNAAVMITEVAGWQRNAA